MIIPYYTCTWLRQWLATQLTMSTKGHTGASGHGRHRYTCSQPRPVSGAYICVHYNLRNTLCTFFANTMLASSRSILSLRTCKMLHSWFHDPSSHQVHANAPFMGSQSILSSGKCKNAPSTGPRPILSLGDMLIGDKLWQGQINYIYIYIYLGHSC